MNIRYPLYEGVYRILTFNPSLKTIEIHLLSSLNKKSQQRLA